MSISCFIQAQKLHTLIILVDIPLKRVHMKWKIRLIQYFIIYFIVLLHFHIRIINAQMAQTSAKVQQSSTHWLFQQQQSRLSFCHSLIVA